MRTNVGRVLRRARAARRLSLRRAADASGGRFAPTTIASYERGERSITIERFTALATLYGVAPERLFAEATRAAEGRSRAVVRRSALPRLIGEEGAVLRSFVRQVTQLRRKREDPIVLRAGDVEVLAAASGRRRDAFLDAVAGAIDMKRTAGRGV